MSEFGHSPTARAVLGRVLTEARTLIGRSPEQVGEATGLSGRTIRRLETGLIRRPHTTTLEGLADFYALDADVLHRLVGWVDLEPARLPEALRGLDETAPAALDTVQLAMRLARRGFDTGQRERDERPADPDLAELTDDFLALDRRRRLQVRLLLRDLRLAAEQERASSSIG